MSETKHTPGPWTLGKDKHDCIVITWQDDVFVVWPVAWTYLDDSSEQGKANGRLIAAAPDLLAACMAYLENLDKSTHPISEASLRRALDARDAMRIAVTKATGGEP